MIEKVEIEMISEKELRDIKEYAEAAFGKVFESREKAKQRIVYDLLNYLKTNNRNQFLYQVLKLLAPYMKEESVRKLSSLLNKMDIEYDTPENFQKLGYTIIMGIMSSGGE